MKNILSLIAIVLFAINIAAQPTRPGTRPGTRPVPTVIPLVPTLTEAKGTANDFLKEGLPPVYVLGGPASPEMGARAAREIAAYDDDSLRKLIGALQKAGFYIMDRNQKTLYPPVTGIDDDMAMAFFDFEVAGMHRLSAMGGTTTIKKIAEVIVGDESVFSADGLAEAIMADLRNSLNSKDPQVQFLAHMTFEFSKTFPNPVDLRTATPDKATINIIQASLIERMMLRDLMYSYEALAGVSRYYPVPNLFGPQRENVSFVKAAWKKPAKEPCPDLEDLTNLQKREKSAVKVIDLVKQFGSIAQDMNNASSVGDIKTKKIFSPKVEKAFLSEEAYKNYGKGMAKVNAVLNWVKLIMAAVRIEAKIEAEKPLPLIRVQSDKKTGDVKEVTAKFEMNIPDADLINCVAGKLSQISDLSFTLPEEGPMKDRPVSWQVILKGDRYTKYSGTPVWVDALNKTDISRQKSDSNGESKIKLTGKPQRTNLENERPLPVTKLVDLRVSISPESMDFSKDVSKLGGLFGTSLDPVAIFGFIPEMLGKMDLAAFNYTVPVRDWVPCGDDWGGEINYTRERRGSRLIKGIYSSNGNSSGDGSRSFHVIDQATISLNPRTRAELAANASLKPATIFAYGGYTDQSYTQADSNPCCGKDSGSYDTAYRFMGEGKYSYVTEGPAIVNYIGSDNDYQLGFQFTAANIPMKVHEATEVIKTECSLDDRTSYTNDFERKVNLNDNLSPGRYPERLSNTSAGILLQGSKSLNGDDGSRITWSWALARCKE